MAWTQPVVLRQWWSAQVGAAHWQHLRSARCRLAVVPAVLQCCHLSEFELNTLQLLTAAEPSPAHTHWHPGARTATVPPRRGNPKGKLLCLRLQLRLVKFARRRRWAPRGATPRRARPILQGFSGRGRNPEPRPWVPFRVPYWYKSTLYITGYLKCSSLGRRGGGEGASISILCFADVLGEVPL